jgi:hypothetical protein
VGAQIIEAHNIHSAVTIIHNTSAGHP